MVPAPGQTLTFGISTEVALSSVWDSTGTPLTFTPYSATFRFIPELGPLMIAIFMISTLAAVILSKNHISKKKGKDSD